MFALSLRALKTMAVLNFFESIHLTFNKEGVMNYSIKAYVFEVFLSISSEIFANTQ
jgi:hypothetical protein